MTDSNKRKEISKILLSNAQVNKLEFNNKDFTPTGNGHGLFVKTVGMDTLYDLRLAKEKPFLGHTHPIVTHHNFQNLTHDLELHYYSVPKTEYVSIVETFQKVNFKEVMKDDFKITYHNIVIDIDESLISYDFNEVKDRLNSIISENPETFFWLVEKDLILFSEEDLFNFTDLMRSKHVHLCLDFHFIGSVFIYSHHLFSEDQNIQLFLAFNNLYQNIISLKIEGKNKLDFTTIDNFLNENADLKAKRRGRYLIIESKISKESLNQNGIVFTESEDPDRTVFAFPISCTTDEVLDVLNRVKASI